MTVGVVACGALALHVARDRAPARPATSTSTRCRRSCTTGPSASRPRSTAKLAELRGPPRPRRRRLRRLRQLRRARRRARAAPASSGWPGDTATTSSASTRCARRSPRSRARTSSPTSSRARSSTPSGARSASTAIPSCATTTSTHYRALRLARAAADARAAQRPPSTPPGCSACRSSERVVGEGGLERELVRICTGRRRHEGARGRRRDRRGHRRLLGRALPHARGRAQRRRGRPGADRRHRRLVVPRARPVLPDQRLEALVHARAVVDASSTASSTRPSAAPGGRSARSRSRPRPSASPSSSAATPTRRPGASRATSSRPTRPSRHMPLLDRDAPARRAPRPERRPRQGRQHLPGCCRQRAESRGAEFIGLTRVDRHRHGAAGRVRGVETDQGAIAHVDGARLRWASGRPEFMRSLGLPLVAMQPMQHLFAWTEPLPELAGATRRGRAPDPAPPGSRDVLPPARRAATASAPTGTTPITIEPAELERHADGHQIATGPFSRGALARVAGAGRTSCCRRSRGVGIAETFNGHFSFAVDNNSFAGPLVARSRGLWLADGIWVTHAGGTAKAVVDLMTTGRCELDLGPMHPDRLHRFQRSPLYVKARGAQQYDEVYDIIHPRPGAGASARRAHDALARALPRARRRADRERRLGARAVVRANDALPLPAVHAGALGLGAAALVADDRPRAPRDAHRRRRVRPDAVRQGRGRGAGRRPTG